MIHDPSLVDLLIELPTQTFVGEVFRATRQNLDPTTPSTSGGRWAPRDGAAVLYTSLTREGALAEICYHWSRFTPRPTKTALVHRLGVKSERTLKLIRSDLAGFGVDFGRYREPNYRRTQEIGAIVAFIGCDGLIIPSARWDTENLVLFTDNLAMDVALEPKGSEEVDWQEWGRSVAMLED